MVQVVPSNGEVQKGGNVTDDEESADRALATKAIESLFQPVIWAINHGIISNTTTGIEPSIRE